VVALRDVREQRPVADADHRLGPFQRQRAKFLAARGGQHQRGRRAAARRQVPLLGRLQRCHALQPEYLVHRRDAVLQAREALRLVQGARRLLHRTQRGAQQLVGQITIEMRCSRNTSTGVA